MPPKYKFYLVEDRETIATAFMTQEYAEKRNKLLRKLKLSVRWITT